MPEKGNLKKKRKRPEKKGQYKLRYDCNLCALVGEQVYTVCPKLIVST